jgi:hypothetical protein
MKSWKISQNIWNEAVARHCSSGLHLLYMQITSRPAFSSIQIIEIHDRIEHLEVIASGLPAPHRII